MDLSGLGLNYLYAAFIILTGITIAFLARRLVRWLESKAVETSTFWDDILIAKRSSIAGARKVYELAPEIYHEPNWDL